MTLDKVVEILRDLNTSNPQSCPEERVTAVYISIAAVQRIRCQRLLHTDPEGTLLQGETKED